MAYALVARDTGGITMKKNKIVVVSLTVVISFVAGRWIYHRLNSPSSAQATQGIQSFTLQQDVFAFARKPAGELTSRRTLARRTDGSESQVDVVRVGETEEFQILRKVEFADGAAMTLIDSINGKLSGFVDGRRLDRRLQKMTSPPRDCLEGTETVVGRETLFGEPFLVVEGADGRGRRRTWKSMRLGCTWVQLLQEQKNSAGGWDRQLLVVLTGFNLNEPEPQLFAAGEKYKEMTPTQSYLESARRRGIDPDSCSKCKESVWELEKAYWAKQAPSALP